MDMDNAATWFAGMILITLGIIVIVAGATFINNILHKYWKPVTIFSQDSWTLFGSAATDRYIENHPEVIAARKQEQEKIPPTLDDVVEGTQNGKSK